MLFSGVHGPYCKEARGNVKALEDVISSFKMISHDFIISSFMPDYETLYMVYKEHLLSLLEL